jgi:hypothetical protein
LIQAETATHRDPTWRSRIKLKPLRLYASSIPSDNVYQVELLLAQLRLQVQSPQHRRQLRHADDGGGSKRRVLALV